VLSLREGDQIRDTIEADGRVVLSRVSPAKPADDPFATFEEWDGEADRKAYARL